MSPTIVEFATRRGMKFVPLEQYRELEATLAEVQRDPTARYWHARAEKLSDQYVEACRRMNEAEARVAVWDNHRCADIQTENAALKARVAAILREHPFREGDHCGLCGVPMDQEDHIALFWENDKLRGRLAELERECRDAVVYAVSHGWKLPSEREPTPEAPP